MSWFLSKTKNHSEQVYVPKINFLGKQDGLPERELKSHLIELFQGDKKIKTAYLAQVVYGDGEQLPITVALCLFSQFGSDPVVVEKIGKIFASLFGKHECMDIIFLDEQQESVLAKVCPPFFNDLMRS